MINVFSVGVAAVVLALIISSLRRIEPGISGVLSVCATVWLLFIIAQGAVYLKNGFADTSGINAYMPYILKSAGIGFFAQTAADICTDAGERSAGAKIMTIGKLGILTVCLPLVKGLLDTALGYIGK